MASELPHGSAGARPAPLSRVVSRPATASWLLVAGLTLLAIVIRLAVRHRILAPWIMGDELIYSSLARSFHDHRELVFHQRDWPFASIYPIVISPAWRAASMADVYSIVKAMNIVLMSLVVVPVHLWARRLVSPTLAVVAVALTLMLPVFVYANSIMTESLAFPAVILALYAIACALERPTILRQLLAVGAIVFASTTRLQALVLFIVLPTAILLKVLLDARADPPAQLGRFLVRGVRRFAVALGVIVGAAVAYVLLKAVRGGSVHELLGQYRGIENGGYPLGSVVRWIVLHAAEISYSVALVPAFALIVVAGLALRKGAASTDAERAFLAVTLAATFWIVLQVGAFASRFSGRIEERNMFYLAPLLLLALVVWIDRGLPRPSTLAAVAALVPTGLLIMLPLESLLNISATSDTFSFVPLMRVTSFFTTGLQATRILLGLGAITMALAFLLLPRRIATFALPAAVGLFFVLTSYSVLGTARAQSFGAISSQGVAQGDVSWIDEAVGPDARVMFVNTIPIEANPHTLWQAEFWNRSIDSVLNLTEHNTMLGRDGRLNTRTGRLTSTDPIVLDSLRRTDYVVAPAGIEMDGDQVANPGGYLALYRVNHPVRMARNVTGQYLDGWTTGEVDATRYTTPGQRPGVLIMRLLRPTLGAPGRVGPAHVTVQLTPVGRGRGRGGPVQQRSLELREGVPSVVALPAPRPPFRTRLVVTPTFTGTQVGVGDPRTLGARLSERFVPEIGSP